MTEALRAKYFQFLHDPKNFSWLRLALVKVKVSLTLA